jgi:hypothetical protein
MRKKFIAQYKAAEISDKMIILDVKTWWNSTFDMLTRARELKEVSLISIYFEI